MKKISQRENVNRKLDAKKYARLLATALPTVIETEEENERLLKQVGQLMKKGDALSIEEAHLLKLLSYLIEEFETKHYEIEDAPPHEVLKELMLSNNLRQADLLPIFRSRGIASEVINGKRAISKAQAKALAEYFNVSPSLFI